MKKNLKLMECGHMWVPKRGLRTWGLCLDCYKKHLENIKAGQQNYPTMDKVRDNVNFCNMVGAGKVVQLKAFFDAVMPEIPPNKAHYLAHQIARKE